MRIYGIVCQRKSSIVVRAKIQAQRIPNVQSDGIEYTLNVQIHHLCESRVRMRIELLPPRRPRVRKQDIDMISRLRDLFYKPLNIRNLRAVGRNRDRNGTRAFVR